MTEDIGFSGSYDPRDVTFLLDPLPHPPYVDFVEKERRLQSGEAHYSEMLTKEKTPSDQLLKFFDQRTKDSAFKLAQLTFSLAKMALERRGSDLVLVSIARAGTPVGVLMRRALFTLGIEVPHYSISLIRGRGVDQEALKYLVDRYSARRLLFVDGWASKGGISQSLRESLIPYKPQEIIPEMWTLSDPLGVGDWTATQDDLLIPHALLNAPVSGLISRTVYPMGLGGHLPSKNVYHGTVLVNELCEVDRSCVYVNQISEHFPQLMIDQDKTPTITSCDALKGEEKLKKLLTQLGFNHSLSRIKFGVGESCRALLRRSTTTIFLNDLTHPELAPLIHLAKERAVSISCRSVHPFLVAALIGDERVI